MYPEFLTDIWYFISKIPFWFSLIILLIISFISATIWVHFSAQKNSAIFITIFLFGMLDWILLTALPFLKLSYGPVGLPLLGMIIIRFLLFVFWLIILLNLINILPTTNTKNVIISGIVILWIFNICLLICEINGLYFEPFNIKTTKLTVSSPFPLKKDVLKIIQLSDLHIERITKREQQVIKDVNALNPDIIVLTGDYINTSYLKDPLSRKHIKWIFKNLNAPYGIYAITASNVDTPDIVEDIFKESNIILLNDEIKKIKFDNKYFYIIGVSFFDLERDKKVLKNLTKNIPNNAYKLLLYHTPDIIETACEENINLLLAGHTHGGQIRAPIYGAILTSSTFYKKYEMGKYEVKDTILYVSRGIGMEGTGTPRARFLCSPEIVLVEIK